MTNDLQPTTFRPGTDVKQVAPLFEVSSLVKADTIEARRQLDEARGRAEQILEDARREAQRIVADAARDAETSVRDARDAARREGLDELAQLVAATHADAAKSRDELHRKTARLALLIARRLIVGKLGEKDEAFVGACGDLIAAEWRPRTRRVELCVHPDRLAALEGDLPAVRSRLGQETELALSSSRSLGRGDIRLVMDGTVRSTGLTQIRRNLRQLWKNAGGSDEA